MVVEMNYNYDAKFEGKIFVLRRIGYEKTTFVQNLGKNKMFGNLKEEICKEKSKLNVVW